MSDGVLRGNARVPAPPAPFGEARPGQSSRRLFYLPLARVQVRHEYYDATGGACPDFTVRPTAWTAALMHRLGLLFRQEEAGFTVLYNHLREDDLLRYIEANRVGSEPWTRLCFSLTLRNPLFVNFTDLPVETNPATWNLYLTNRQAHTEPDGTVLLTPRGRVSAAEMVPATGGQIAETVEDGVWYVQVLDVSGEAVLCKPRCVSVEVARSKPPAQFDCGDRAPCPDPAGSPPHMDELRLCSDQLYFDLSGLPEEKYQLQTVWCGGRSSVPRELLYTADYPIPLGLVELLLADPTGGADGVYPVRPAGSTGAATIEGVTYEMRFGARRTWWSYYIMGDASGGTPGEPRIRQQRAPGEPRVAVRGPCRVCLPGGRQAWRFVSRRPIALEQRSPLHLQLLWRRDGGRRVDVVMDRLPVASAQQVLPMLPGEACVQARRTLCDPDHPGRRCRRLVDSLCDEPYPGFPGRRTFSDIYVNV